MRQFDTGTIIILAAIVALACLIVTILLYGAGAFTKATSYEFGKLAELAGNDMNARDKVRKLRAQDAVTLQEVKICANEIEEMLDRKRAAEAFARLET